MERWDTLSSQRIAAVGGDGSAVDVVFEDGTRVGIDPRRLLPRSYATADWSALTHNPHEIVVPTASGDVEVSWLRGRALTDPAFEAHLRATTVEEARFIGSRIAQLRQQRGLPPDDLAQRAGVRQATLAKIQAGHDHAGFSLLERILAPLGATPDDPAVTPDPPPSFLPSPLPASSSPPPT